MAIADTSPNLAGVLRRMFPAAATEQIQQAYTYAIENGGGRECDFERDPEASYNPRPARIALILINNAEVREVDELQAALLATVPLPSSSDGFSDLVRQWAQAAARITSEPSQADPCSVPPIRIALAHYLDRARHLHLAPPERWPEVTTAAAGHIALAATICPPLHVLIDAWYKRFSRTRTRT
ncbi:MAG: hypothetical protein KDD69_01810 [Bdellovibrionales bacterium]|nr:hypothetical protein [Bdellovibrionales bacterium]